MAESLQVGFSKIVFFVIFNVANHCVCAGYTKIQIFKTQSPRISEPNEVSSRAWVNFGTKGRSLETDSG